MVQHEARRSSSALIDRQSDAQKPYAFETFPPEQMAAVQIGRQTHIGVLVPKGQEIKVYKVFGNLSALVKLEDGSEILMSPNGQVNQLATDTDGQIKPNSLGSIPPFWETQYLEATFQHGAPFPFQDRLPVSSSPVTRIALFDRSTTPPAGHTYQPVIANPARPA